MIPSKVIELNKFLEILGLTEATEQEVLICDSLKLEGLCGAGKIAILRSQFSRISPIFKELEKGLNIHCGYNNTDGQIKPFMCVWG